MSFLVSFALSGIAISSRALMKSLKLKYWDLAPPFILDLEFGLWLQYFSSFVIMSLILSRETRFGQRFKDFQIPKNDALGKKPFLSQLFRNIALIRDIPLIEPTFMDVLDIYI